MANDTILGTNFEQALVYALKLHTRPRATGVPTMSRLLAVSATVLDNGGARSKASRHYCTTRQKTMAGFRGSRT